MNVKRKAAEIESKKLENKCKASKVGESTFKSKQPLKKDLVVQLSDLQNKFNLLEKNFQDLQVENEALQKDNHEKLELIKSLNTKIACISKEDDMVGKETKETQTVRGIELKCCECDFEAETSPELSSHLSEKHGWSEHQKINELDMGAGPRYCKKCNFEAADGYEMDAHVWYEHEEEEDEQINCQHCDQTFSELKDLMTHKKNNHEERVRVCRHFIDGSCSYGEEKCWFVHKVCHNDGDKNLVNCSFCGKDFESISNFMKHKKSEHKERVKLCKNNIKGNCSYLENCWFIHEHLEKNEKEDNNEMMQKIFDIVEKYTKKVNDFEKQLMKQ